MPLFSRLTLNKKSPPSLNTFQVGQHCLSIVRTTRKKSIGLKPRFAELDDSTQHVQQAQAVILVPKHLSDKRLLALLTEHQAWLHQALKTLILRQKSRPVRPVFKGQSGDLLEFLGVETTLQHQTTDLGHVIEQVKRRVKERTKQQIILPEVAIHDTFCTLYWPTTQDNSFELDVCSDQACQAVRSFMQVQAVSYLEPKLSYYAEKIGVKPTQLTVKGYKSRWGSCYSDGRIQFNWRLMQAPSWVIDYVVVHELCHLIHPNHSKEFWALVNHHYPQTPQAKHCLKINGTRWIHLLA